MTDERRPAMTLAELSQATRLAAELKHLQEALKTLREDRSLCIHIKVEDLLRTYGSDRARIVFPYARERLLAHMVDEETRLVDGLAKLGVVLEEKGGPP